jgi:hypothetical protein
MKTTRLALGAFVVGFLVLALGMPMGRFLVVAYLHGGL